LGSCAFKTGGSKRGIAILLLLLLLLLLLVFMTTDPGLSCFILCSKKMDGVGALGRKKRKREQHRERERERERVDEAGTVATAATAVATTKGALRPVTKVYINRPFGFSVIDRHTRETLFVARVVSP